jgi:hypothetical protein
MVISPTKQITHTNEAGMTAPNNKKNSSLQSADRRINTDAMAGRTKNKQAGSKMAAIPTQNPELKVKLMAEF